jgi:hypothetical protein
MGDRVDAEYGGSWRPAARAFGTGREAPHVSALTLASCASEEPYMSKKRMRSWITSDHPRGERGAIYGGAAVGDLVRLITSPDLGPQVVFQSSRPCIGSTFGRWT